ncbi:MAG: FitA-like ribbon-helix-helix domain-containing protein [Myxococcota bacterium]
MSVNLSIKDVPDAVADALRRRARANRRSLQKELLALLEESVGARPVVTPQEALARVRAMELSTPDEATDWIRAERDAR